jgi:hypothetical protein
MARKKIRADKEALTAIRLSIPSELWRKFRAGCIYMDKDVNSELNKLLDSWVKEWHKRITRPEATEGEQEHYQTEKSPFGSHGGYSTTDGE